MSKTKKVTNKKNNQINMKDYFTKLCNKTKKTLKNFISNLTLKKICIYIMILSIIGLITYTFFQFSLLVTPDGSAYYRYLDFFQGDLGFENWRIIRGFGFPVILFIITSIFGESVMGLLIGFFIFYLLMLYFGIKIIRLLIKDNNLEQRQVPYWIMFLIFFLPNPLILGYSLTLLTEAIMPFFYMLVAFLCLKWNNITYSKNKKRFIIYSLILIFLGVYTWFIKQPYAPAIWVALLGTSILSGIYYKNKRVFIEKFIVFILCIVATIGGVFLWDGFLKWQGHQKVYNINSGYISTGLIGYLYHYKPLLKDEYCNNEFISTVAINEKTRDKINQLKNSNENWCSYLRFYEVYDLSMKKIETQVIVQNAPQISIGESLKFVAKSVVKHPLLVLDSYYKSYMSLINLYTTNTERYITTGKLDSNIVRENIALGYYVFNYNYDNCWWIYAPDWVDYNNSEHLAEMDNMKNFETKTSTNSTMVSIMQIFEDWSEITYKIILLFTLPIFIYSFIMFIKHRDNLSYFTISLLSGMSFGHIFFYCITSAIIDRYIYPVYPLMLLCVIISFMDKSKRYCLCNK